jgi:DNA-directed RNA polymerase specialized sigma subunit
MILEEKVKNFCLTGDYSMGKDILEQSYKLANTIVCNKYKNFGYTEDLLSESHDAIISAIYAFNPDNKTKFLTFCSVCINNRIQNFIKRKKVSYKYVSNSKDQSFSDLEGLDILNSLKSLSKNHFNCLTKGEGSRSMKFRAKRKLINGIID